jgi:hypothetical protein
MSDYGSNVLLQAVGSNQSLEPTAGRHDAHI